MGMGQHKHYSAAGAVSVTPSDVTNLTGEIRGLFIGGDGNVAVETVEGDDVIFSNVTANSILPIRVVKVKSTGTTATNILAFYN